MDEIKIQENLVQDKHIGDFEDAELNYPILPNSPYIDTHVLVFLLRSVADPFKFSLEIFATTKATLSLMFPLLWKVISIFELNSLNDLAITCDSASPNCKLLPCIF